MTTLTTPAALDPGARLAALIAKGCAKPLEIPVAPAKAATDLWYADSYGPIVTMFANTRTMNGEDSEALKAAWVLRKLAVGAWLRGIFKTGVDPEVAGHLLAAERALVGATLADDVFPGTTEPVRSNDPDFPLQALLELANRVLNRTRSVRLASSTKLLHFMLPELVPLIDTNVCQNVFGKEAPTMAIYLEYVRLLRSYLREGEHRQVLFALAHDRGVSPVRLVDTFVFR